MHTVMYIGGLIGLALIVVLFTYLSRNQNRMTKEQHEEDERICFLIAEAVKRYPNFSAVAALMAYSADIEKQIQTLRENAINSDVYFILKSELRDRTLLQQEIAWYLRMEIEYNSHFNVLTAAQV